jgi:glutamate-1-semialdehyde 2,1-aminomutase
LALGATNSLEIELGEAIRRAMPSMELLRFTSSGTEAVMSALRVARAATGRDLVVKFAGAYPAIRTACSSRPARVWRPRRSPAARAFPTPSRRPRSCCRSNDAQAVTAAFAAHAGEIAAVIVEPVVANAGVISPLPGYLEHLREVTRRSGALLVFDEVITGFRLAAGGAQARFGISRISRPSARSSAAGCRSGHTVDEAI